MPKSKKLKYAVIAAMMAVPGFASAAEGDPPISVSALSTSIVGWVGGAAVSGFAVYGALAGVRYIKRAFKSGAN